MAAVQRGVSCRLFQLRMEFSGSGPVEKRQEHSHIHSSILSESGHELFVADLGGDNYFRRRRK